MTDGSPSPNAAVAPGPSDASAHSAPGDETPSLFGAMLLTAMAGGLGWGIRGQYGHETGAMIAGVLVGLTLLFLFGRGANSLVLARAAALTAIGVSFGGSMTYGQTVGLTHDAALVGNWAALRWGLLGLFLKGGIWIGFAGAFLGMGLSPIRYRPVEWALLMWAMLFLMFLGNAAFNEPYDPEQRLLPKLYFSDHWHWEPEAELRPRRERWGGLLLALVGLWLYAGWVRRDRLVRHLTFWAFLSGGIGFAAGQSVQAFHAWNPNFLSEGSFQSLAPHINWWNMMETIFGAIWGGGLALGLWRNRARIDLAQPAETVRLQPSAEWALLAIHVPAVFVWNFLAIKQFDQFADLALTMGLIPVVAVVGGRYWPYWLILPIVMLPIAGKTVRELCFGAEPALPPAVGVWLWGVAPLAITAAAAFWFAHPSRANRQAGGSFVCGSLLLVVWLYFLLNWAFFRSPWPWQPWTNRTPNGIIFFICAAGLTAAVLAGWRKSCPECARPRAQQRPNPDRC